MANVLSTNFNYTYNGREVLEAFVKPSIENPDVKRLFKVRTGVRSGDQLFLAETLLRKKLREKTSCTPSYATGVNLTNRKLETKQLVVSYEQCEQEFQGTAWEQALASGIDTDRISSASQIQQLILEMIRNEVQQDFFRLFCFGDDSDDDPFYGSMEGLWPRLLTGVNEYCVGLAGTNFTTGSSFAANEVINTFRSLYADADPILKQLPNDRKAIYVTGNVYEEYLIHLENQGNEFGATIEVEGLPVVAFRGIPVIPIYDWDAALGDTDCPLNGSYTKFALYTTPENHVIGLDGANDDAKLETWFSQDDRVQRYHSEFRLGYQYIHCDLQIIAAA